MLSFKTDCTIQLYQIHTVASHVVVLSLSIFSQFVITGDITTLSCLYLIKLCDDTLGL